MRASGPAATVYAGGGCESPQTWCEAPSGPLAWVRGSIARSSHPTRCERRRSRDVQASKLVCSLGKLGCTRLQLSPCGAQLFEPLALLLHDGFRGSGYEALAGQAARDQFQVFV